MNNQAGQEEGFVITDHSKCRCSTGICGNMTAGQGELSPEGYWEFPCAECVAHLRHLEQTSDAQMAKLSDLTNTLCVDQATFRRMRNRWHTTDSLYDTGKPVLDEGIAWILKCFNAIDGIVTNWSCESHPDDPNLEHPHVVLAVTSKGLLALNQIWGSLNDRIERYNRRHSTFMIVDWEIVKLLDPTKNGNVVYANKKNPRYTAHDIQIINMPYKDKYKVLRILGGVVSDYVITHGYSIPTRRKTRIRS